jgi:non-specific serine/threonine protein kinase
VLDTLAEALADGTALIVLDNCEHLISAAAQLAESLLLACPGLTVVATSREALVVSGESIFPVGALSLPDPAGGGRARLLRSEAVQLFVDRAGAAQPGFELTADNGAAVAGICTSLDGNALAIELAARWVRMLGVDDILARLNDRFRLLTTGPRTAARRHRDLRAAIDWSYDLLDPAEQAVFRRLSVLTGGFTLDGAAAVGADGAQVLAEDVLDLVAGLEAKSLVVPAFGDGVPTRFRQLESIRLYARERLAESGEEEATWQRMVGWLTARTRAAADQFSITADTWAELGGERDNLLAALDRLAGRHDDRQVLLAAMFARRWSGTGYERHGRVRLRQALDDTAPTAEYRSAALIQLAWYADALGDPAESRRVAESAFALASARGQPILAARALVAASVAGQRCGDSEGAYPQARAALDLLRPVGRPVEIAMAANNVAYAGLQVGAVDEASALLTEYMPVYRSLAEPWLRVAALHTAGALALFHNDTATAAAYFRECIEPGVGRWINWVLAIEGLAIVAVREGNPERALRLFAGVARIRREWPDLNTHPDAAWLAQTEAAGAAAHERLGRARARAAEAGGGRLTVAEVAAYALDDRWTEDRPATVLTERERAVAALVAEGLTNRQIAGRLGIVERTVEAHLENIRTKLDLRSKAQVASWAAENAITPDQ